MEFNDLFLLFRSHRILQDNDDDDDDDDFCCDGGCDDGCDGFSNRMTSECMLQYLECNVLFWRREGGV